MAKNPAKPGLDILRSAASGVGLPSAQLVIPAAPKEPSDVWQIVVIGSLDARQHTPLWYHLIGCLSDAELEVAKKSHMVVGTPVLANMSLGLATQVSMSQFDIESFAVIAVHDKWTIQTTSKLNRDRILDVADKVFKKLNEVYVSAYGVNRMLNVKTSGPAKQFLARKIAATDMAFPREDNSEAQITFTAHHGDFDTTFQLIASHFSPDHINILYNRHHPIKATKGYYDLGEDMRKYAEDDWRSASEYGEQLAQCVARAETK